MRWHALLHALWLFLPAYVANMSPVFTAKLLPRWSHPIDGGRTDARGNRILGAGKTWRGLVGGALAGGVTALAMAWAASSEAFSFFSGWGFGWSPSCADCSPLGGVFALGAAVGLLALVGDAVKSYFKRRTGRKRGAPWFPFDQLDFVAFGLLGFVPGIWLLADGWIADRLFTDWLVLTTIVVGTPALHLLVNRIGYWLRLKEVPW